MSYATIDALRESLGSNVTPAYTAKMIHDVPKADVVDRTIFLLQKVAGKRVLEFGASGPMHDGIVKAAALVLGVDRESSNGVTGFDLDDVTRDVLPYADPEIIVCGEVLEHLSNPGWFLTRLKRQFAGIPVVITVPNAFNKIGAIHINAGRENVNADHVAYYSYTTLKELLRRVGYGIAEFHYYNGAPYTAEGLIVVTE